MSTTAWRKEGSEAMFIIVMMLKQECTDIFVRYES